MANGTKKFGILVGGGPAPGINSVISSVTIEAMNLGYEVTGILDGFRHLIEGKREVQALTIPMVSRIHLTGGSVLRTSRANPTRDEKALLNVVRTLIEMGINYMVTIGGDDTAFSASCISSFAKSRGMNIRTVHIPKTIDNDLPLPEGTPTFGFETARELGTQIVNNLMEDAQTTGRWFIVVAMGRKAGHLALGIGKSAGVTLTLIPEEFLPQKVRMKTITDIIVGSIIKRNSQGRDHGVAVLAEGLLEAMDPEDLNALDRLEKDPYGNIRLSEVNFSDIIKQAVLSRLREFGLKMTVVDKEIGYEVRCASPSAFDIEYTRNLGYAAVEFLHSGGTDALISIQNNKAVPIPFAQILDAKTGKTAVRMVNIDSAQYQIARQYMIRLEPEDFHPGIKLEQMAMSVNLSVADFCKEFKHVVEIKRNVPLQEKAERIKGTLTSPQQ